MQSVNNLRTYGYSAARGETMTPSHSTREARRSLVRAMSRYKLKLQLAHGGKLASSSRGMQSGTSYTHYLSLYTTRLPTLPKKMRLSA